MRPKLLAALLACSMTTTAFAQSLADVAKQEEARRRGIKHPARVFTNADLGRSPAAAAQAVPAGTTAPATPQGSASAGEAAGASKPANPPAAAKDADQPKDVKDKAYWQKRMNDARVQLERTRLYMDALQTRINSLWADFTARDDPAQRALLAADRQRALGELDRLKTESEEQRKAIAGIEEEARRANVPPGWLR